MAPKRKPTPSWNLLRYEASTSSDPTPFSVRFHDENTKSDFFKNFSQRSIHSIIDVYRDSATRDKLIFPLAITRILCHFSVPFPLSDHFFIMGAIDAATVKWSEARFRSRWYESAAPPIPSAPSTSTPSSSTSDVTLEDIMVQFQHTDACLDTFNDELCQVNTRVGHIA